jgi:hypothetical protein
MKRKLLLIFFLLIGARPAFALTANSTIYWDQSHTLPFLAENGPEGRYSELANHLHAHGFLNVAGTTPLTALDLSTFDILAYGDAMVAFAQVTDDDLQVVRDFVYAGGGLLLMSDIHGSGGHTEMNRLAALFGAQVGLAPFGPTDIYSTRIDHHPVVENVNTIYFRFSSTFDPGILTPYVFHFSRPMLAAGRFGAGRIVILADSDALGNRGDIYIDREDNRQLALSIFRYLAVPERSTCSMLVPVLTMMVNWRRRSSHPRIFSSNTAVKSIAGSDTSGGKIQ